MNNGNLANVHEQRRITPRLDKECKSALRNWEHTAVNGIMIAAPTVHWYTHLANPKLLL